MSQVQTAAEKVRQYEIFYRNGVEGKLVPLEPGAHRTLYERPAVAMAVEVLKTTDAIEAISLRVGQEQFQLFVSQRAMLSPRGFELEKARVSFQPGETQ